MKFVSIFSNMIKKISINFRIKFFFIFICFFSKIAHSQSFLNDKIISQNFYFQNFQSETVNNFELKVNILDLYIHPALNFSYEKYNNDSESFGLSIFTNLSRKKSSSGWKDLFSFTPYYRFYISNNSEFAGAGFFGDIFSLFSSGEHEVEIYDSNLQIVSNLFEKFFDISIGAGVGYKFVNQSGFSIELNFRLGRFLTNSKLTDPYIKDEKYSLRPNLSYKGGISVGKRF